MDSGFDAGAFLSAAEYATQLQTYQLDHGLLTDQMDFVEEAEMLGKPKPVPVGEECMVTPAMTSGACLSEWNNLGAQCLSNDYAWSEACTAKEVFDYAFTK